MTAFAELYKRIGQPIFPRPRDRFLEMARPWKVSAPGALPLDEWLGIGKDIKSKEMETFGGQGFYGVILEK